MNYSGTNTIEAEMKDRVAAKDRTIAALYDEIETMKEQRSDLLDRLEKLEAVAEAARTLIANIGEYPEQPLIEALAALDTE